MFEHDEASFSEDLVEARLASDHLDDAGLICVLFIEAIWIISDLVTNYDNTSNVLQLLWRESLVCFEQSSVPLRMIGGAAAGLDLSSSVKEWVGPGPSQQIRGLAQEGPEFSNWMIAN